MSRMPLLLSTMQTIAHTIPFIGGRELCYLAVRVTSKRQALARGAAQPPDRVRRLTSASRQACAARASAELRHPVRSRCATSSGAAEQNSKTAWQSSAATNGLCVSRGECLQIVWVGRVGGWHAVGRAHRLVAAAGSCSCSNMQGHFKMHQSLQAHQHAPHCCTCSTCCDNVQRVGDTWSAVGPLAAAADRPLAAAERRARLHAPTS